MKISKIQWLLIISGGFLGVLFLIIYTKFNPSEIALFPKCPFHLITGLHCPGCGSQRAIHAFLQGNIWQGLQHNFLMILLFLLLFHKLYQLSFALFQKVTTSKNLLYHPATAWVIVGVILLFWILRNLPFAAFQILAP
ncbi:MAG: DUF2752 domain-containing protein [Bacteroidota bacterium]